jgi:mannosyl-3-phosphoglycerate phosphatase
MPYLIIFSDLDGTLLDHHTYRWEDARPALERCSDEGVPVIVVSSKTRAEIDDLRKRMGIEAPFVSENGGGIFFPHAPRRGLPAGTVESGGLWKWELGENYRVVVKAFREIGSDLPFPIKGFSDMDIKEISRLTGLDPEQSRLASDREFDEPFVVEFRDPSDEQLLKQAAARKGLNVTCGGRFHHLFGHSGKGAAMEKLTTWYRSCHGSIITAALGDSPNDFAMLERADHPVLIKSHHCFPELFRRIERLKTTSMPGPAGWKAAVTDLLNKLQGGNKWPRTLKLK